MIQRSQSVFMLFAFLSLGMIMYKVPVLAVAEEVRMLSDFLWAQIAAFVSMFLVFYSIFQFKNRSHQLMLNQLSKFSLSISFFLVFIQSMN